MNMIKSLAIAGLVAAASIQAASAEVYINARENFQYNWGQVSADLKAYAEWVDGKVTSSTMAIGNNYSSTSAGAIVINNTQFQLADVSANVSAGFKGIGGLDLTVGAICNNASIESDGGRFSGTNIQRCMTKDPAAAATVYADGVGSDAALNVLSIANNVSVDVTSPRATMLNSQINPAATVAKLDTTMKNVKGAIDMSVTAIGNNASIVSGF